ncbi:MAG TPA: hypothetical protein VE596_09310 [Gaiellaceae bacterium]|nr:hypothetical protein [Gaiellaceae bacterium]
MVGAIVVAAASGRLDLLWLPLAILGLVELLLARYRLRTDNWRERDGWTSHRAAALLLFGTHDERRGAALQIAFGVAVLLAAVLLRVI